MADEIYKDFVLNGTDSGYEVSNMGNVRNKQTGKIISHKTNDTIFKVKIHGKIYSVHRLVAEMFIPNPDDKTLVKHINKNKQDNRVENLKWTTHKEEYDHKMWVNDQRYGF